MFQVRSSRSQDLHLKLSVPFMNLDPVASYNFPLEAQGISGQMYLLPATCGSAWV